MRKIAKSKYNVDSNTAKRTYNGIVFDSVMEMRYYRDVLRPKMESGDVVDYKIQKPYELQPGFEHDGKKVRPIVYIADFYIVYKDGTSEVIEIKGMATPLSNLKRKMFWNRYPDIDYKWLIYSEIDGGWCDYEYVKKQRANRKKAKSAK